MNSNDRQADRISFRHFLSFPVTIPDRSTIWSFKNRLIEAEIMDAIWNELLHPIDALGLQIKRGVIQNVTFITSDRAHVSAEKPRGEMACTRRSRDGTRAKKGSNSHFGFKLHTIIDREHQLIRAQVTTTASVHDSRIYLSQPGETVYRDKGYFGVKPIASMDKTMHRAVRDHPVSTREKQRNRAIRRV